MQSQTGQAACKLRLVVAWPGDKIEGPGIKVVVSWFQLLPALGECEMSDPQLNYATAFKVTSRFSEHIK